MPYSKDKYVAVRIWYSKVDGQRTNVVKAVKRQMDIAKELKRLKDDNTPEAILLKKKLENEKTSVGHVAIETPSSYVSLWPGENESVTSLVKRYESRFHTFAEDEIGEWGPGEVVMYFYTLQVDAIDKAFDQIKKTNVGYVLGADSSSAEKGESCCTIAYKLLQKGGIDRLGANKDSIMQSVIITPGNFAKFIHDAKHKELLKLDKDEQAKGFKQKDETVLPPLQSPSYLQSTVSFFQRHPVMALGGTGVVITGIAAYFINSQSTKRS